MSTAVTDYGAIETALTSAGYSRLEDGKPLELAPTSKVHKSYTMEAGEPDIVQMTGSSEISSRLIILRASYKIDPTNTYEKNLDTFETLYGTIKALAGYMNKEVLNFGYAEGESGRCCIGEFEFYYGVRTC